MKGTLLGLIVAATLFAASTPAHAHGPRYGFSVYSGYRPYYAPYRPYYGYYRPYWGPAYYPPPVAYYPAPYAVYPPPAPPPYVGGFYASPGFSFSFGR